MLDSSSKIKKSDDDTSCRSLTDALNMDCESLPVTEFDWGGATGLTVGGAHPQDVKNVVG